MVATKPLKHSCPYCGAIYEMRVRRGSHRTYHTAVWSFCGDVMAEWHGFVRHYRRIGRPRSAARLASKIVAMAAGNVGRRKRRRHTGHTRARATRKAKAIR